MPKFLMNRWHGLHIIWGFILMLALVIALSAFVWQIGVVALLLCGIVIYYTLVAERAFRRDFNNYVATLTHRVKRSGSEVINELPIGILLYNEERTIEWHNPFVARMVDRELLLGVNLSEVFPMLKNMKATETKIVVGHRQYEVLIKPDERLLYFTDVTEYSELLRKYQEEKPAVGIILLDNLEEATQGMDDQKRSMMLAKVVTLITEWAHANQIFLRRIASDKFMIIMDQLALRKLEQDRFEVLDDARELTSEYKLSITLSIGIASGIDSLIELGNLAQSSLDIALGRGGDQAAVKVKERLSFYGGKSNAVEKRTRVRARVISHALRDLIGESDNVVIFGHRNPDMDAIGAAIGVLKAAQVGNKVGYIVLEGVNPSIHKLMKEIKENENINKWFVSPEQALQLTTERTLVVVVDTHKASMVAEPKLLQQSHRIVVVDHHRRSEEFINEAVLVYMEPYASSTCELVTELLQYFNDRMTMDVLEATALLAGIVVDTKSFALRTGARTFEAASFLRRSGADAALIQRMLKEDLDEYMEKAEIIKHAKLYYDHIAIAISESGHKYSQLLIAQVADTLLNMTNVMASFVISERQDGLIGISARSLGQINVQVVMERLGGGGHLTNAAVQLEGTTLKKAENKLKKVLEEMHAEEGLFL